MDTPIVPSTILADLIELVIVVRQRAPYLATRLQAAAGIVTAGQIARTGADSFRVQSSNGTRFYTVDLGNDVPCDCPDCASRRVMLRNQPTCKHALAGGLLNALERKAAKRQRLRARVASSRCQPHTARRPVRVAA